MKIKITTYQKWQKPPRGGRRSWVKLATGLYSDPAILACMGRNRDAVHCYLWLLLHADEQGELEISAKNLKRSLVSALQSSSRLDVENLIELLKNNNLIEGQLDWDDCARALPESCDTDATTVATTIEEPQTQSPVDDGVPKVDKILKEKLEEPESTDSQESISSLPTQKTIWSVGINWMISCGVSEAGARPFLGQMAKEYGQDLVLEALRSVVHHSPADPKSYLRGTLRNKKAESLVCEGMINPQCPCSTCIKSRQKLEASASLQGVTYA